MNIFLVKFHYFISSYISMDYKLLIIINKNSTIKVQALIKSNKIFIIFKNRNVLLKSL